MTHTDNNGDNAEQREKRYYYHSDHLGSAQFVTDWRGKQYEHIEYTPYGELWIEEVAAGLDKLPFRFTGKEMDEETGLYYYGARYLDPKYSRWISTDPALSDYIPKAPIDDEAKKHNENLPGMGGVFNVVNLHLYHYAGNNPIKYEDPDGRVVDEITSQYHMTDYENYTIPGSGIAVNLGGCAITLDANVCYSAGDTATTPATIAQDASNFDASGNLLWSNPLPDGISIQRVTSSLTVQKFNEYQDSETHYYIGIKVQYKGTPDAPSTSPHWVGATSVYTDSAGTNYFVISPTSGNDGVMGTDPGGNNRGGLGWQNIPDVGIVVPVNRVTDYIIYTQQGGIQ